MTTKTKLREIYKKRINFNSSPLVWLLWISSALLVVMFIIEVAVEINIKDIILWILLVFLVICVLMMVYFVLREEFQRIITAKNETLFEFAVTDENLFATKEYLINNGYICIEKSGKSNNLTYKNSSSSYVGQFILHVLVADSKIRMNMQIRNKEKRFLRHRFEHSKHGLYGMILYPAKIKFRKHLAVVLELLEAPEEFRI